MRAASVRVSRTNPVEDGAAQGACLDPHCIQSQVDRRPNAGHGWPDANRLPEGEGRKSRRNSVNATLGHPRGRNVCSREPGPRSMPAETAYRHVTLPFLRRPRAVRTAHENLLYS